MFTGIVEEVGSVVGVDGAEQSSRITLRGDLLRRAGRGDSVAVSGVCLTVVERNGDAVTVDVMAETLLRSSLAAVAPGDLVNLELAATPTTMLGGHVVQGHVDGVGHVVSRTPGDAWEVIVVAVPQALTRYVVEKGSIALDGVSLTVVSIDDEQVTVSLIPETLVRTTWGSKPVGAAVNVEVDVIAKYVERLLATREETRP
jgi:riboflavin synthase